MISTFMYAIMLTVVMFLILCGYCSPQCSPSPPAGLSVPEILTMPTLNGSNESIGLCKQFITVLSSSLIFLLIIDLQPKIGGQGTDWFTVFSETQVREHGLWCQVLPEDNMGMGDNIGDWYYPPGDTPDGFTQLPNSTNDTVPYQSLKCTNQIGLVVDGDVTNNQGIVRCTTNITGLQRQSNYFVVYSDAVFNNYSEYQVAIASIRV